jgi:glycosyltransferase involved in cell wall biosynthesis
MYIVYLVNADLNAASGGLRVIFEHVARLIKRGHIVEVWYTGVPRPSYFMPEATLKPFVAERLSDPDVVIMADSLFLPIIATYREKHGNFLLLQHDNAWIEELNGDAPGPSSKLFTESRAYFDSGYCRILVVGNWLHEMLKEKFGLQSHIVKNGINEGLFHPTKPLLTTQGPLALLVYDPQVWKGFNEAVGALLIVRQKLPELNVAILCQVLPPVSQDGVYGRFEFPIIFFHSPNQADLAGIYSSADVFVSASWKEGFGLPGLEAMACGVPLVTTDSGGVRDYAIPAKTAIIVPARDPSALANGILSVLNDKKMNKMLIANGMRKAAEFKWDDTITSLEQCIEKSTSK